jgi:hypothetical protein
MTLSIEEQEYIRKAVELADGWECNEHVVTCHHKLLAAPLVAPTWYIICNEAGQIYRDAIAAQLVRQVDALTGNRYFDVLVWELKFFPEDYKGNDRTMNTIKAIVDSAALENDE